MKELIGKRVFSLYVTEGEGILVFETDQGRVAYGTDADCCSETWFADIVGVPALLGEVVLTAEDIDMPNPEDDRGRQEYDQAYGVKLTTAKGYVDIVFRNSSNGYYGGSIGLWTQPLGRLERLQAINEDWMAGEPTP